MDSIFIDGIKHKDGIKRIPYFGIYQKKFYTGSHSGDLHIFPTDWTYYVGYSGTRQHFKTDTDPYYLPIICLPYTSFGFTVRLENGNYKSYYPDIGTQEMEELKRICPPIKYSAPTNVYYYSINYSNPTPMISQFCLRNPSTDKINSLKNRFNNKTFVRYCLHEEIESGHETDWRTRMPTEEEKPYLRDFFGGNMGIRAQSYFDIFTDSYGFYTARVSFGYTAIPWD